MVLKPFSHNRQLRVSRTNQSVPQKKENKITKKYLITKLPFIAKICNKY